MKYVTMATNQDGGCVEMAELPKHIFPHNHKIFCNQIFTECC